MQSAPFFSIVIPVFNRAHAIGRALESVFAQERSDYEVIVVDDGSSDDIVAVVRQYQAQGVRLLGNDRNLGVGPTRNKGVAAARGQWVAFLDSDSYLLPAALSILHATIGACDERVGVVYGRSEQTGTKRKMEQPSRELPQRWSYREFLHATYVAESLPVTRRELLLRFPFPEQLGIRRECGTLVWSAIARAGYDLVWTESLVQEYELSPGGLSGRQYLADHPEEMVVCNEKILEEFGGDLLHLNRKKLISLHQKTAFYCLMSARRSCALRHVRRAWMLDPVNLRTWLLLGASWMSPRTARRLYAATADVVA
jgi:glycosyltransferase involved in cell wall biosynthesis